MRKRARRHVTSNTSSQLDAEYVVDAIWILIRLQRRSHLVAAYDAKHSGGLPGEASCRRRGSLQPLVIVRSSNISSSDVTSSLSFDAHHPSRCQVLELDRPAGIATSRIYVEYLLLPVDEVCPFAQIVILVVCIVDKVLECTSEYMRQSFRLYAKRCELFSTISADA